MFIFIFATAGLLGWAAIKPWVGKWVEVSAFGGACTFERKADKKRAQSVRERRSYIPLPNQADN